MRTGTKRAGAAFVLTAGLVAGCESSRPRTPYADNPLIQARQPLLQPYQAAGNEQLAQVAQSGPKIVVVPPPGQYHPPATAVASRTEPPPVTPATPTYTPPAPSVSPPAPPAPPLPLATEAPAPTPPPTLPPTIAPVSAPPTLPDAPPPVTQAVVRQVEGKYGHAADYSWLQGELDRHYRGHLELRFRAATEEDRLGGKVRLEDDPRLAEFRPGDVIAVEGELLSDPDGNAPSWSQYRRFHIRAVRLVERK